MIRRKLRLLAMLASLALVIAACGGEEPASDTTAPPATDAGTDSTESPAEETTTTATMDESDSEVVQLTYWAGITGAEGMTELWNEQNPNIQVEWVDPGISNLELPSRMINAVRGGDAPDVTSIPTLALPQLILAGVPADITEYVADAEDAFPPGVWGMNEFAGEVYGMSLDVGPMMLLYRADRFEELGLTPPETWEEFAELSEQVRDTEPGTYLSTFDPGLFHFLAGHAMQAGGQWWSFEDDQWDVGFADDPSLEVAAYWDDLIERDLVAVGATTQPEWAFAINEGTILSFPSAVWAAGTLLSIAPDTAGLWEGAPIPEWNAGDPAVGQMGGSSSIVTSSSDHPAEAAEFVKWMTAEGSALWNEVGSTAFPAAEAGQENFATLDPPPLVEGQEDYYQVAVDAANDVVMVDWGPNTISAITIYIDEMNRAVSEGSTIQDALRSIEEAVRADLIESGFSVREP